MSPIEIQTLKEHYQALCQKENGTSVGQQTFSKYFLKTKPELSKLLWKAFDFDKDGVVDEIDFITAMAVCLKFPEESRRKCT